MITEKIYNRVSCISICLTLIGTILITYGFSTTKFDLLHAGLAIVIFCMLIMGVAYIAKECRQNNNNILMNAMLHPQPQPQPQPIIVIVHRPRIPQGLHSHRIRSDYLNNHKFLHIIKWKN
jgi:hypothetical protein